MHEMNRRNSHRYARRTSTTSWKLDVVVDPVWPKLPIAARADRRRHSLRHSKLHPGLRAYTSSWQQHQPELSRCQPL